MSLTITRVSLTIADGQLSAGGSAPPRGPLAIVGPCSSGDLNTPTPVTSITDLQTTFGYGPLVEAAGYALAYEVDQVLLCRTDTALGTAGAYGAIGLDITGSWTATADGVVKPSDDLEDAIRIITGGTLGTTGIVYQYSLDGGRKWSGNIALGTATSITLPRGGGKFNLAATDTEVVALANELRTDYSAHIALTGFETALFTLLNELKTDYEAHRVLIAGGVHGAADVANVVTAANATNIATAIALANDIRTQYEAHRVLIGGGEHGAADNTNAITAPVATNGLEALTLALDLKAKFNAHIVLTTGGVHGAADSTNTTTSPAPVWVHGAADATNIVAAPAATNLATAITLLNELRGDYEAHRILVAGGEHGAADATNALTAPAATDGATAAALANDLKAKFNSHRVLVTASVHGSQDTTNVVSTANATYGNVIADDAFDCVTTAPRWSSDELVTAMEALRDSSLPWSLLEIAGPVATDGEVQAIHQAILDMRDKVKYRRAVGHFRARNDGETLTAYAQAYETAFGNSDAETVCLTPSLYLPSAIHKGAAYVRPFCFAVAPRLVRSREDISPAHREQPTVGFGSIVGQVRDTNGNVLPRAVDEAYSEVFTPRRAWAPRTWADKSDGAIYSGQGATLADDQSDYQLIMYGRIADLLAEAVYSPLADRLQKGLVATSSGKIDPNERKRIEEHVGKVASARLVNTNILVSARIVIDPNTVVTGAPPISVPVTAYGQVKGYVDEWAVTVALVATVPS